MCDHFSSPILVLVQNFFKFSDVILRYRPQSSSFAIAVVWNSLEFSFTFSGQIAKPPKYFLNKANSFILFNNSNFLKEDKFGSEHWNISNEMSFVEICLVCQLLWTVRINRDVWFFIFAAFLWHQNTAVILFNFQVWVAFDIRQTCTKLTILSLNKGHAKGLRHT